MKKKVFLQRTKFTVNGANPEITKARLMCSDNRKNMNDKRKARWFNFSGATISFGSFFMTAVYVERVKISASSTVKHLFWNEFD